MISPHGRWSQVPIRASSRTSPLLLGMRPPATSAWAGMRSTPAFCPNMIQSSGVFTDRLTVGAGPHGLKLPRGAGIWGFRHLSWQQSTARHRRCRGMASNRLPALTHAPPPAFSLLSAVAVDSQRPYSGFPASLPGTAVRVLCCGFLSRCLCSLLSRLPIPVFLHRVPICL